MDIKIKSKEGITLYTAKKYLEEDIQLYFDKSLIPSIEGTLNITSNGDHDVTNYATASVNVPIPDGYIVPAGTLEITESGTYDVTQYAAAEVDITAGIDTSDATATNKDILVGKTAYIGSGKVEGTIPHYDGSNSEGLEPIPDAGPSFAAYAAATKGTDLRYLFYQNYATNLDEFIKVVDFSKATSVKSMFNGCNKITSIPEIDLATVTDASELFRDCNALLSAPIKNTSNLKVISYMFFGCNKLTSIQMDTSSITNLSYTFQNCYNLASLSPLITDKVSSLTYAFYNCYRLPTIDITTIDHLKNASDTSSMCNNCYSLTKFIIRNMSKAPVLNGSNPFKNCYHFTGTVNSTYNPEGLKDGRIYVPDEMVDTLKAATNWSAFADIIVPLSTLEE